MTKSLVVKKAISPPPPEKSPNNKNQVIAVNNNARGRKKDLSTVESGYRLANKYEVKKKLGEGGFGAAFLVSSLTAAVPVTYVAKAQKLTDDPRVNEDLLARFTLESQALQKLGTAHGQIPSLFDFFEFEGNFYLIQEYIKGQNLLDALITRAKNNQLFSEKEVIEITLSLLEVLTQVHATDIIHRDIKHPNIILRDGDGKPVLIDFGIIKNAANYNPVETGTVIGTPGYCPLEQAAGHVMFQSDLYAVGMVALVSLTGIPPHGFPIAPNPITSPQESRVVLDEVEDYISPPLLMWLKQSLAVLPQNRFASAEEMREALLTIYNLEYIAKGVEIAAQANQKKMQAMEQEIASLRQQLKASGSGGKKPRKGANQEDFNPGSVVQAINNSELEQIITTQKEVDGFNAIKRIFKNEGLDTNRLQMKDTVEYCGINIDGNEKKTLVRLYFNDENNLSFSIVLANGKEENFPIKTLRGIAPKKDDIIRRAKELMTGAKPIASNANSLFDLAISELGFDDDADDNTSPKIGKTQYLFDGQKYGKGRLVLAVVTEYIKQNPKLTLAQLQTVFPKNLHGSVEIIEKLSVAEKRLAETGYKRFYMNDKDILRDGNNEKIVVTTQWGNNMDNFLKKARDLNFVIKEV